MRQFRHNLSGSTYLILDLSNPQQPTLFITTGAGDTPVKPKTPFCSIRPLPSRLDVIAGALERANIPFSWSGLPAIERGNPARRKATIRIEIPSGKEPEKQFLSFLSEISAAHKYVPVDFLSLPARSALETISHQRIKNWTRTMYRKASRGTSPAPP